VLLRGCSSLGFSLGSAEPQALHAVTRLKEKNNTSCCTGLGRVHVFAWAGCQRGQGLPASLPASSSELWHTAGVLVGPTAGRLARTARSSAGDLAAHQLVCRALHSQHNRCTRPTGGTDAMGATKCNRRPAAVSFQESTFPSGTEGAGPRGALPAWSVCSAAIPSPWAHPLPCLLR